MAKQHYRTVTQRFLKGVYAVGGIHSALPTSVQRASNLLLLPRGTLRTVDGSFAFFFECPSTVGPSSGKGQILAAELFRTTSIVQFYAVLQSDPASPLSTPTGITLTEQTGGSLAAGTYSYRVSAIDGVGGETLASAALTITVAANAKVKIDWTAVTNAFGYNVYGRTSGSEVLLAAAITNTFTDDGTAGGVLSQTRSPGGATSIVDFPVTLIGWVNPQNVLVSDDLRATATFLSGGNNSSGSMPTDSYGFTIPGTAQILGVELRIERSQSNVNSARIHDKSVRLVVSGQASTNKAAPEEWPTSDTVKVYGSPTDLWGKTDWTPEMGNAAAFGGALSVERQGTTEQKIARVDHMPITVFYSLLPGPSPPTSNTSRQIVLIKPSGKVCYTKPGDIVAKFAHAKASVSSAPGESPAPPEPSPPGGGGGSGGSGGGEAPTFGPLYF